MNQQKAGRSFNRREFVKMATAAVGGIVAAPLVITNAALGAKDRAPASERIGVGVIGVGGRGRGAGYPVFDFGNTLHQHDYRWWLLYPFRRMRYPCPGDDKQGQAGGKQD